MGHVEREWRSKRRAINKQKEERSSDAAGTPSAQFAEVHGFAATSGGSSATWIIDSGASHHLSGNRQAFRNFQPLRKPVAVRIADGTFYNAVGSGMIHFNLQSGKLLTLEALYVPAFGVSLLSVRMLIRAGFHIAFREDDCWMTTSGAGEQLLGRHLAETQSYILLGEVITTGPMAMASVANGIVELHTWHQRFAHLNFTDLRLLLPKNLYAESKTAAAAAICATCATVKAKQQF